MKVVELYLPASEVRAHQKYQTLLKLGVSMRELDRALWQYSKENQKAT